MAFRKLFKCFTNKSDKAKTSFPDVDDSDDRAIDGKLIEVKRKLLNKKNFDTIYPNDEFRRFNLKSYCKKSCCKKFKLTRPCLKQQLYNRIPAIQWLKNYKFGSFFLSDLVAGLSIGIMHIPFGT